MIAKITKGSGHAGTVNYVMRDDKGAELIDSKGVLTNDRQSVIDSFRLQCQMNSDVKVVVGHISLNFSVEDTSRITNELMAQIAQEYMQKMGIKDTQYILVRHHDREHPHCHLVFNRVNDQGKVISDSNDRKRSARICKELTIKYNLHIAQGKEHVKRERLKEPDATRYRIYDALDEVVKTSTNWNQLKTKLEGKGIKTSFIYKGKTTTIQGVTFEMNGLRYKGSQIDRRFSYSKLSAALNQNAKMMGKGTEHDNSSTADISVRIVGSMATAAARTTLSMTNAAASTANRVIDATAPTPSKGTSVGGGGTSGVDLADEEYIDEYGIRRKKKKGIHR